MNNEQHGRIMLPLRHFRFRPSLPFFHLLLLMLLRYFSLFHYRFHYATSRFACRRLLRATHVTPREMPPLFSPLSFLLPRYAALLLLPDMPRLLRYMSYCYAYCRAAAA